MADINGRSLRSLADVMHAPMHVTTRRVDELLDQLVATLKHGGFSAQDTAVVTVATRAAILLIVKQRRRG